MQQEFPRVKIQLASGFVDDRHADMMDERLHQNLLHKPINSQTLLRRIRMFLDEK